jgi:hypothetical protein
LSFFFISVVGRNFFSELAGYSRSMHNLSICDIFIFFELHFDSKYVRLIKFNNTSQQLRA